MEPFRAFVGDMLRKDQHTAGYAVQTAFIGAGAVVGSIFPELLDKLGVSNTVAGGGIPDTVRYSFWFGGAALLLAVLWTVLRRANIRPTRWRRSVKPPSIRAATRPCARSPAALRLAARLDRRGRRRADRGARMAPRERNVRARRAADRLRPRQHRRDSARAGADEATTCWRISSAIFRACRR